MKPFIRSLLEDNAHWRYSDIELMRLIRFKYPNSLLDVPVGRHKNRLAIWRSEYNRGLLAGPPPTVFSFRYHQGVPCNHHLRPLSQQQIHAALSKFSRKKNASTQSQSR